MTALVAVGDANETTGLIAAVDDTDNVRGVQSAPLTPPFGSFVGRALYHLTVHGDADGEGIGFTSCEAVAQGAARRGPKTKSRVRHHGRQCFAVAPSC